MSKIVKNDDEWKSLLDDESYRVTRQSGTEKPFTGKYWDFDGKGSYKCICCGQDLFESDTKFDAGCGWPSFFIPKGKNLIEEKIKWMKEGDEYEISMWEDKIINVEIQNFIEMEISETEPGFKGDTSTNTLKEAVLSNGIEIKVPLFIEAGDVIKVDTRNCEYQNRVNK